VQFHYLSHCRGSAGVGETGLEGVLGSSITYRIAVGPQEGRKAFCLQSLPPAGSLEESNARVAKVAGFSLHAGVATARHERQKLEQFRGQYTDWPVSGDGVNMVQLIRPLSARVRKSRDRTARGMNFATDCLNISIQSSLNWRT